MTTTRRVDWGEIPAYAPPADTGLRALVVGWVINATFLAALMLACPA